MRANVPELLFPTRADFRAWLTENAESSDGIWLIFGKTKALATVSANDALEEALCFGWIDGQMQRVDEIKYLKYFARRRSKSPWSDKNKRIVETLRQRGSMTPLGEQAVENAKQNGTWDAEQISDIHMAAFAEKLAAYPPAHAGFLKMPRSGRLAFTRRHHSFKTEEARARDFLKIIDELQKI